MCSLQETFAQRYFSNEKGSATARREGAGTAQTRARPSAKFLEEHPAIAGALKEDAESATGFRTHQQKCKKTDPEATED
eukprot:4802483-Lingulodinium_polyedra.AAC.1